MKPSLIKVPSFERLISEKEISVTEIDSISISGKIVTVKVSLSDDLNDTITLKFFDYKYCRSIDEGHLINEEDMEISEAGTILSEVMSSALINDFHILSDGILKDEILRHFVLYTDEDCIDVISSKLPEISTQGYKT
ncbi:MAG TPA: hypothetical protein DCS30_14010 [Rhizobiales bacterium]|nr:hypothetical protein [Hyphomicrobiales bacterium]